MNCSSRAVGRGTRVLVRRQARGHGAPAGKVPPPSGATPVKAAAQRLESLDVFRGATIAAIILVNNPGDWNSVSRRCCMRTGSAARSLTSCSRGSSSSWAWRCPLRSPGVANAAIARRRSSAASPACPSSDRSRPRDDRGGELAGRGFAPVSPASFSASRFPYLLAALVIWEFEVRGWMTAIAVLLLGHWALLALVPFGGFPGGTLTPGAQSCPLPGHARLRAPCADHPKRSRGTPRDIAGGRDGPDWRGGRRVDAARRERPRPPSDAAHWRRGCVCRGHRLVFRAAAEQTVVDRLLRAGRDGSRDAGARADLFPRRCARSAHMVAPAALAGRESARDLRLFGNHRPSPGTAVVAARVRDAPRRRHGCSGGTSSPHCHRWPTERASFAFGMAYVALWVMVAGVLYSRRITRPSLTGPNGRSPARGSSRSPPSATRAPCRGSSRARQSFAPWTSIGLSASPAWRAPASSPS